MHRPTWSNRITYILTVAGATVGFGATWRFPYMVGQNGGGAYVAAFCAAMIIVGIPMILVENVIGRGGGCDTFSTFERGRAGYLPHKFWRILGASSLLGAFAIMAFYMVLGAWVLSYIAHLAAGVFGGELDLSQPINAARAKQIYAQNITASPGEIGVWTLVFVMINYFILRRGIIDGIERSVKFLMPMLFICLLALVARNLTLPGVSEGLRFYLMPDFSKITPRLLLDVLGQVFFALSLGFGVMITLSSHLDRSENMLKTSLITGAINTLIAVLAGFMIFPSLFSFGVEPTAGPELVFQALLIVFSHMHFGALFGLAFFALLLIAALTTTLPIYQVIIAALAERWGLARSRAIFLTLGVIFLLGNVPCIISPQIFGAYDFISGNILFTLTSLGCVIFVGWGLGQKRALDEISNLNSLRSRWYTLWFFYVKWLLPLLIAAIFAAGIWL